MGDQDDVEKHSSQGFAQDFSCMNNRGPQAAQVIPVTVSPQNIDSTTDGEGGELNPQDAWLPLTESRKGTTYSATFHLLSSGIGIQALLLPVAFATLGCGREEVQQHISRRISMWLELRGQSLWLKHICKICVGTSWRLSSKFVVMFWLDRISS